MEETVFDTESHDMEPYPMRRKKCTDLIDLQNENETSIKRHRECTV